MIKVPCGGFYINEENLEINDNVLNIKNDIILPEVTEEDNGDVLTVVDGSWGKAKPSGGGGGFKVITLELEEYDSEYKEYIATPFYDSFPTEETLSEYIVEFTFNGTNFNIPLVEGIVVTNPDLSKNISVCFRRGRSNSNLLPDTPVDSIVFINLYLTENEAYLQIGNYDVSISNIDFWRVEL